MWKVIIVDEATGEILDSAKIDPDRQPDKRKHVKIQVKRNGQIVGKGWGGLLRLHEAIHDRIALEGRVCETCDTKGCHRPATWEIECRGVGVSGRLIYSCDEHAPDEAILSPQDEIRRLVEE